jgi:hypothetical protein
MIISFHVLEHAIDRDDETNFYRAIVVTISKKIYRASCRDDDDEFYRSIRRDDVCKIDEVINISDVRAGWCA